MKTGIINKYLQKANGLETTSEARGSDLKRLVWAPDSTVYRHPADLTMDVADGSLNSLRTLV